MEDDEYFDELERIIQYKYEKRENELRSNRILAKPITARLIQETSFSQKKFGMLTEEEKIEETIKISEIHLEWCYITEIDNLEVYTNVQSLHLSYNQITKLENLECCLNLEFLILEGNLITEICGLNSLKKLLLLNLGYNKIEEVNMYEIPNQIVSVNLTGNPCVVVDDPIEDFRKPFVLYFPHLEYLNALEISVGERLVYTGKITDPLSVKNIMLKYSEDLELLEKTQKEEFKEELGKLQGERGKIDKEFCEVGETASIIDKTEGIFKSSIQRRKELKEGNLAKLSNLQGKIEQLAEKFSALELDNMNMGKELDIMSKMTDHINI